MGFFHACKEVVTQMASRIQGITVEIGGDTTKLSKALESVNKSIKGTQSGLKDVNKLLKLDPSNTELVVQKQKMLKDAIEATKEKAEADVDETEFPTAEELPATIAYGKLKTLMNIRKKPDTSAEIVTVYKKNTLVEIIQFCDGWLKIKCAEAEDGVAYVLNSADTYAFTASKTYTVQPGDNLWKIAKEELGDGSRCADIRTLNGLTSNAIRVGMKLLIP